MQRPNHASRFEGIAKTKLQASRASDTETLQSQVNKAAEKRLSLSGLEILHGRLGISRITSGWATLPSMCSMILLLSSNGFPSTRPLLTLRGAPTFSVRRLRSQVQYVVVCAQSSAFQSRSASHVPSTSRKLPRKWPNQTG